MVITIDDVNMYPPQFIPPWTPTTPYYVLTIPERQPPPAYVTTMVATDPDNDVVAYMLVNDTGEFNLVPQTGNLNFVLSVKLIIRLGTV